MLEACRSSDFLHAAQGGKFEVGVDEVEMECVFIAIDFLNWPNLLE